MGYEVWRSMAKDTLLGELSIITTGIAHFGKELVFA